jgi:outer membrane protein assembly factor BamB
MALVFIAAILGMATALSRAEDWPTFMHDNARSGVTAERLDLPLTEQWVYHAPAPPKPAWPDPQPDFNELPKVKFDDALYTVAVGSTVFFGSSVDNQVYALDAATAAVRWTFFTGGPVRLAPTVDRGRVYFGSDDGKGYCLAAEDGRLIWEYNAAPESRRVIGNGRIISLWPVRTGMLVDGNRVYFGSGLFPFHAASVVSLDAETGVAIPWKGHSPKTWSGLSPQGYLLRCRTGLVVPCGRAMPAVLDCESGNTMYTVSAKGTRLSGGVYGVLVDNVLHTGTQNTLFGFDTEKGAQVSQWAAARQLIATPDSYYALVGKPLPAYGAPQPNVARDQIAAVDRAMRDRAPRNDETARKASERWVYRHPDMVAMILAGDRLVVGCKDEVTIVDTRDGRELWNAKVNGDAVGLTVAHGRLLVSTTRGSIHCFALHTQPARIAKASADGSWPADSLSAIIGQTADGIVRESGVRRGYALVTGSGAVRLGCELARRSELNVTCIESDPARLPAARQRVAATGVYGTRVTVEPGGPEQWPYPEYAANLVVHVEAPGEKPYRAGELLRILKPCGGVLVMGSLSGSATVNPPAAEAMQLWEKAGVVSRGVRVSGGSAPWTKLVRGVLEGSGSWTHCYADAGNTGASDDRLVRGTLGVLWFGEPGADEAPDRHQKSVPPLVVDGRVFYQGWRGDGRKNTILSFDAYNGLRYWAREIPGAVRFGMPATSGNLACTTDSLFVVTGSTCHRLDALTGETKALYETPPEADGTHPVWGHLAVAGGRLFGSTKLAEVPAKRPSTHWTAKLYGDTKQTRFSNALFAIDIATGRLLWVHRSTEIRDSTIAIAEGRLFFTENRGQSSPPASTPGNSTPAAPDADATHAAPQGVMNRFDAVIRKVLMAPLIRTVVALDAATGKPAWERELDFNGCGIWGIAPDPRGGPGFAELQALCKEGVLVFGGAYQKHDKPPADAGLRRALAVSARDGSILWSQAVGNLNRPLIIGDALLAGPHLRGLQTGEPLQRPDPKTGVSGPWSINYGAACGTPSACNSIVFFRGGWRNVMDGSDGGALGLRAGCFINVIPAGGVVVQPEAGSGCTCLSPMQCTVVFSPREENFQIRE